VKVSHSGAEDKLTQLDRQAYSAGTVDLGLPTTKKVVQ
jgi:hypothetical protein